MLFSVSSANSQSFLKYLTNAPVLFGGVFEPSDQVNRLDGLALRDIRPILTLIGPPFFWYPPLDSTSVALLEPHYNISRMSRPGSGLLFLVPSSQSPDSPPNASRLAPNASGSSVLFFLA
jgi:hypothetical protein